MQNTTLTPRYRLPGGFMIDGATLLRAMLLLALNRPKKLGGNPICERIFP